MRRLRAGARGRARRPGPGSKRGRDGGREDLRARARRLRRRVPGGDRGEVRVGEAGAEGVADHDVAAECAAVPDRHDGAVLRRHDRRPRGGEDVGRRRSAHARCGGADRARRGRRARVAGRRGAGLGAGAGDARGPVARVVAKLDREVALGEVGDRVDQRAGLAAQQLGAVEHRLHVGVRVVVGEDRAREVVGPAGRGQVARGGEDRVSRVVGVACTGRAGVDAVALPGARQELHPADRAGRGGVEVGAVVGLDLVDRCERLPGDAVGGARGLVDRKQERRDVEALDVELRHVDAAGDDEGIVPGPGQHAGERVGAVEEGGRRCDRSRGGAGARVAVMAAAGRRSGVAEGLGDRADDHRRRGGARRVVVMAVAFLVGAARARPRREVRSAG